MRCWPKTTFLFPARQKARLLLNQMRTRINCCVDSCVLDDFAFGAEMVANEHFLTFSEICSLQLYGGAFVDQTGTASTTTEYVTARYQFQMSRYPFAHKRFDRASRFLHRSLRRHDLADANGAARVYHHVYYMPRSICLSGNVFLLHNRHVCLLGFGRLCSPLAT